MLVKTLWLDYRLQKRREGRRNRDRQQHFETLFARSFEEMRSRNQTTA